MKAKRLYVMLAAVTALTLAGAACSSDDGGGSSDAGGGAADMTVTVKDFEFDPSTIDVSSGETTIEITNTGAVEHSFTLDDDSVSQDVEGGDSATITIDPAASIGWHCEYHPDTMKGSITVG